MKKAILAKSLLFSFFLLGTMAMVNAQGNKSTKASPSETATGKVGGATITINYSSPGVKGRKIWGFLVPYDKVWRAGADEATIFQTDKAITFEGKALPAGKYSLFATPSEKEWTIILNSQTGQWGIKENGEANRDPKNDVLTVKVKPTKISGMHERLTYTINSKGVVLAWEKFEVPISIK